MAIKKHDVVDATPEMAEKWLGNDVLYAHQRDWHPTYSDGYASDMAAGLWSDDVADPIVFSESGKLLNGQHRLHAIVKCRMTIPMLVVTVENENGYKFIDTGHSRTFVDLVGKDVKNKTTVGSVSKRIVAIEEQKTIRAAIEGHAGVTLVSQVLFAEKHMDYIQSLIKFATRFKTAFGDKGAISSYATVAHVFENVYGDGTVIKLEEAAKDASDMTDVLRKKLVAMYAMQAPRASASAYVFAHWCDAVVNGKDFKSARIGDGMRILVKMQSEYTCGNPMDTEIPRA